MTQRDRILLGVVATVVALAGYWFLLLAPKREEAAKLDTQVTQQAQRRDEAQGRINAGEAARKGYAENYATIARLGKAVPMDDQVPSLLYQLDAIADRTDVNFSSLKLNQSSGAAAAAPAPPAQGEAAKGGAAAGSATPATQAAAASAPPGSVVGPGGFPMMPFSFAFEGTFFGLERFLSHVERLTTTTGEDVRVRGRLLTVDAVSLTVSDGGFPVVNGTMSATAFLLSPDDAAAAVAPPEAGGASPATPPSGNSSAPAPTTATITGAP